MMFYETRVCYVVARSEGKKTCLFGVGRTNKKKRKKKSHYGFTNGTCVLVQMGLTRGRGVFSPVTSYCSRLRLGDGHL